MVHSTSSHITMNLHLSLDLSSTLPRVPRSRPAPSGDAMLKLWRFHDSLKLIIENGSGQGRADSSKSQYNYVLMYYGVYTVNDCINHNICGLSLANKQSLKSSGMNWPWPTRWALWNGNNKLADVRMRNHKIFMCRMLCCATNRHWSVQPVTFMCTSRLCSVINNGSTWRDCSVLISYVYRRISFL
jgi:hypothetical protein